MKLDPRMVRTRKLLIDSFLELSKVKKFKDITIKDITDQATINRATFYTHFLDKYELLEEVFSEALLKKLKEILSVNERLNERKIIECFLVITMHFKEVENECLPKTRTYDDFFEERIKLALENLFVNLFRKNSSGMGMREIQSMSIFLSWGLYGLVTEWRKETEIDPEIFIMDALPFIKKLLDSE